MNEDSSARATPIGRLFARSRPRISDLPAVNQMFRDCGGHCETAIRQTATLDVKVELYAIEQEAAECLSARRDDVVTLVIFVPEWGAHTVVQLDVAMIFNALVTMYGGDPGERSIIPIRALTPLEQALAVSLARALTVQLLRLLAVPGEAQPRIIEEVDPQILGGAKLEYIKAEFRIAETGDRIVLAVPASAFDRLGAQILANDTPEAPVIDPSWAMEFQSNVNATSITLLAKLACQCLPLSAIAQLQPGTLLEFSGEAIKTIYLTSCNQRVFVGRLGQSRGMFTVLIERPAKASGEQ